MPRAARADSEYFAGTFCGGSRISVSEGSDDEHTPPALRHSVVAAVTNSPGDAIPDVSQSGEDHSEVGSAMLRKNSLAVLASRTRASGEEAGNILKKQVIGSKSVNDSGELEEQSASLSSDSGSSSGDAPVLARHSAADEIRNGD
jgi:hypothetical protein